VKLNKITCTLLLALVAVPLAPAQEAETSAYSEAGQQVQQQLRDAVAELDALRGRIADEKIPLSKRLNELESELSAARGLYQQRTRTLDSRSLDLSNLRSEIKTRQDEADYLSNLLSEYLRNFESGLHISELQRYADSVEEAKLAPENREMMQGEVFAAQAQVLDRSLDRLEGALGGTIFEGTAVDPQGIVNTGRFALVGPIALFRSADGSAVGLAEQRLGSLEPTVIPFASPETTASAALLVRDGAGVLPADTTLGNAHKMEATNESFEEHVKKGGPVMIPIFAMAGLALLVALYKWLRLTFMRKPSKKKVRKLMTAAGEGDAEAAVALSARMKGPLGRMLKTGVEHLDEPRELVEEVMYEQVLTARLQLNRMLPFIAICAAAAPLMGLLGTVTGIINTFKMITVFGSGDVKSLSGGISEALITTKFGLIVAIPSLLLHAFLSRKARGVIGQMETAAVGFVNQVGKAANRRTRTVTIAPANGVVTSAAPDPELVRRQVNEIMGELLGPLVDEEDDALAGAGK
jgi:biopolymer transport protein ExbB